MTLDEIEITALLSGWYWAFRQITPEWAAFGLQTQGVEYYTLPGEERITTDFQVDLLAAERPPPPDIREGLLLYWYANHERDVP